MSGAHRPGFASRDHSLAQLQRDAALARVGRTRRGLIVGAAALTAGFAALVSAIVPGRSLGARSRVPVEAAVATKVRAGSSPSATVTPVMPPLASASSLGLQAPGQAPQSSPSDPNASSQQSPAPSQAAPSPAAAQQQAAPAPSPAPAPAVVSGGS